MFFDPLYCPQKQWRFCWLLRKHIYVRLLSVLLWQTCRLSGPIKPVTCQYVCQRWRQESRFICSKTSTSIPMTLLPGSMVLLIVISFWCEDCGPYNYYKYCDLIKNLNRLITSFPVEECKWHAFLLGMLEFKLSDKLAQWVW